MQKDMLETKVALENTIKLHKDSIKQSRRIEGGIQVSFIAHAVATSMFHYYDTYL